MHMYVVKSAFLKSFDSSIEPGHSDNKEKEQLQMAWLFGAGAFYNGTSHFTGNSFCHPTFNIAFLVP